LTPPLPELAEQALGTSHLPSAGTRWRPVRGGGGAWWFRRAAGMERNFAIFIPSANRIRRYGAQASRFFRGR
jgi:hypothetical protein